MTIPKTPLTMKLQLSMKKTIAGKWAQCQCFPAFLF